MTKRFTRMTPAAVLIAGLLLISNIAQAVEAGDWLLRLRGIGVFPTSDGSGISPDLPTAGLEAKAVGMPELDVTYMATKNIGIELIAAATPHDLDGTGSISALGTVARVWLLPPTLLAQYHFFPDSMIRPYVGAGLNVTFTFGESVEPVLDAALGPTTLDIGESVGWAVQFGSDIDLGERWFVNLDFKYIAIDVTAKLKSPGITRKIDVGINPVVFGLGIGYRF